MSRFAEKINIIYKEHTHELFSYALALGFNKETSMDAIHDVFYKICLDMKLLDNVDNIRFYLLRSLKNRLLDIHKQNRHKFEVLVDDKLINELPFTFNIDITIEEKVIKTEEDQEIRKRIQDLLQNLTDRQREIVYLRYSLDYNYDQIAQILGLTNSACRKLFHKAIIKLKKIN
jgi:RNA polymerase sigma factor, sigma-70 family